MGTTFVTLGRDASGRRTADPKDEVGFWMKDHMLELWLCLLALHIQTTGEADGLVANIRNQWLLASRIGCNGCVPHGFEEATKTDAGLELVRETVVAIDRTLRFTTDPLSPQTLGLLIPGSNWASGIEVEALREIMSAFLDLLDFKVESTAGTRRSMPGSRQESPIH